MIGNAVWLLLDTGLVELRCRVGTNVGKVGDVWADANGESISVVYEEQIRAVDLAASEFLIAGTAATAVLTAATPTGLQTCRPTDALAAIPPAWTTASCGVPSPADDGDRPLEFHDFPVKSHAVAGTACRTSAVFPLRGHLR